MRCNLILVTLLMVTLVTLHAQSTAPCQKLLAVLPTSTALVSVAPAVGPDTRERFELHECGRLEVQAFERGKVSPSLRVDAGESYPPYLFHLSKILALQAIGGASDHVYVFSFEKGRPRLVIQMATKD